MKKVILSAALATLSLQAFAQPAQEHVTDDLELSILSHAVSLDSPFELASGLSTGSIKTPSEAYGVNVMVEVCRGYRENTDAIIISVILRNIPMTPAEAKTVSSGIKYAAENAAYPVTEYSAGFADSLQDIGYLMAEDLIQNVSSQATLEKYLSNLRGCNGVLGAYTTFTKQLESYAKANENSM